MRRTKEAIIYPETCLGEYADLERHLLSLSEGGDLPRFEDLPEGFTAGPLEHYANWLHSLTDADPKKFERGSVIFFDRRRPGLVFPRIPWRGEHQVVIHYPMNRHCLPLSVSHSHSIEGCFSTSGDLSSFLTRFIYSPHYSHVPLMQASTPSYNFAMIRTRETVSLGPDTDDFWLTCSLFPMRSDPEIREIFSHFSFTNQYGTALAKDEFERLHWLSGINLEHPTSTDHFYYTFFLSFLEIYFAAKAHRFGLYYSRRDGRYRKMSKAAIIEIIGKDIRTRFQKARKLSKRL